jgi:uncharacterized protein (DUF983 family)
VTQVPVSAGEKRYFRGMAKQRSLLGALLALKCPQCREGNLFQFPNAYRLQTTSKMNKSCPVCGEDFEREPGFYFGAAYVSYALTVALWVAVLVALYTFDALGWIEFSFFTHVTLFLVTGITTLIVLLPPVYRLSRAIWIHLLTKRKTIE